MKDKFPYKPGQGLSLDACARLNASIALGNKFRDLIGEEPCKIESPHKWVAWYDNLNKIKKEVFTEKNLENYIIYYKAGFI